MNRTTSSTLQLTILTPGSVLFDGPVEAVTAENTEGPFTILPDHARFITLLSGVNIKADRVDGTTEAFAITTAVLTVADNAVRVFVHETDAIT